MRILPPLLVLIFVIAIGALFLLLPGPRIVPSPYNWLGIVPIVAGLTVTIAGARHFDRVRTNIKTFDEPTLLVTDGLFRWSRNPMYLGFVAFLAGLAIALGTLSGLLIAAAFAVIADRWYVRFEEKAMRCKFGGAYEEYARRTQRWL
jgi:protein-S-isoprenylcysteine O-methyltransferase Ste14